MKDKLIKGIIRTKAAIALRIPHYTVPSYAELDELQDEMLQQIKRITDADKANINELSLVCVHNTRRMRRRPNRRV